MIDFFLRVMALFLCCSVFAISLQFAWWVTTPWRAWLGLKEPVQVSIDAVGVINDGKIERVQGEPIARALSHRLGEITEALQTDLTEDYKKLRNRQIALPEASAESDVKLGVFAKEDVNFTANFFGFDFVGIGKLLHNSLYYGDKVKLLLENTNNGFRYFLEVDRIYRNESEKPTKRNGKITGDIHEIVEKVGCDIAYTYFKHSERFEGFDYDSFCEFEPILSQFRTFIKRSAQNSISDLESDKIILDLSQYIEKHPNPALPHLIIASLQKMNGNTMEAVKNLLIAQKISPNERYISENLEIWKKEISESVENIGVLSDRSIIDKYFNKVDSFEELDINNFSAFYSKLAKIKRRKIRIAFIDSGYQINPVKIDSGALIQGTKSIVGDEPAHDTQGHGTKVIGLFVSLLRFEDIEIIPVKVLDSSGRVGTEKFIDGIELAIRENPDLIICTVGRQDDGTAYAELGKSIADSGIPMIAAGGNEGPNRMRFPAALEAVISVGALDTDGSRVAFSPNQAEVYASERAPVLGRSGEIQTIRGTSPATAIVGAVIAGTMTASGPMKTDEVRKTLEEASSPKIAGGPDVLDAAKFLEIAISRANPINDE